MSFGRTPRREDVSFVRLKQRVSHVPLSVPINVPGGGI